MRSITVLHNQSLLDVCLQHYGSISPLFLLAVANNISVTTTLTAGTVLNIPTSPEKNTAILNYYTNKNVKPATALTPLALTQENTGIGYWAININFIVQ